MAFSVIAAATASVRAAASTTGITVDISGLTLADGDCLFAVLGCGDDPGTGWNCTADGWSQLGTASTTTGNDAAFGVMRHFIDDHTEEPTSLTFQRVGNTGTDNLAAIVIQTRGVDSVVPTEAPQVEFTTQNSMTPDNVDPTTTTDNVAMLIAHLASFTTAQWSLPTAGAPSGYTLVSSGTAQYDDGTNADSIWMQTAYSTDVGSAGTISIGSWTTTGGNSGAEAYTAAIPIRLVGQALADGCYHDRASVSHAVTGSISEASFTWDHTPRNIPSGLLVFVHNSNNASNIVTSVTADGTTMSAVTGGEASATSAEPGNVSAYFLGSADLSGTNDPITIVVNRTNNSNELCGYAISIYSTTGDCAVDENTILTDTTLAAYVERNVDDESPAAGISIRYCCGHYGGSSPPPAGANSILRKSFDTGSFTSGLASEAASGNGSRPVGFEAASDDRAAVYLAVYPVSTATPTQTSVARVSLESPPTGEPTVDTDHSIYVRARVTSGAGTPELYVALYESTNNRSGDLSTGALTASLADYTVDISEANAANITDYSNLELRIWGYDSGGAAVTFEVAECCLVVPEGTGVTRIQRYGFTSFQDPAIV